MAIAVAASSSGRGVSTSSLTISHTVPSGTQRHLVVLCFHSTGVTLSGTYGGVTLTKSSDITQANGRLSVLELQSPAIGTANVVLTGGASGTICAAVVTLTDCFGISTMTAEPQGSGVAPTVTVSSAPGSLVLDVCGCSGSIVSGVNFAAGPSQTVIVAQDGLTGSSGRMAASWKAGATSVTMAWTLDQNATFWHIGAITATGVVPELPAIPPGSHVKLLIEGVDRTPWLANGYGLDIEKVLSTETMHLAILDLDSTAGAYRPSVGESVRLTRIDEAAAETELLFGGVIAQVVDEPIIDDTGTVTRLRCRDWMFLADQVFLPTRSFDSDTARAMFTAIVEAYLGPKGVTVISAPTGGLVAPELRTEEPVTTVREALDRLTLNVGWPWRINGDKKAAIVEPGELAGPATLADDGASVLTDPPLTWETQMLTHATRVWVQTATSDTNSGPVEFTESWTSNGATSVYPVHVLPSEIRASTTAAAETLATTLALDGLPPNAMIRVGGRLSIDWHTQLYTVASTVTTDAEGKVTITVSEGLERDVPEGHAIQFKRGAFVQLEVNGVVTPMDGAPIVWDEGESAIVYPGGSWTAGTTITYRTWVYHPVYVREWDPSAQHAIGWFNYETLIDQVVTDEEGHTDIDAARSFAQAELARRLTPSKRVTCTTRIPGHYPLLTVPMAFADRLVTGDYLVTETRIRHSTIDENSAEQPFFYELVLMEGDALGESWIQYFRGRNPSQGIRWGAATYYSLVTSEDEPVLTAEGERVLVAAV